MILDVCPFRRCGPYKIVPHLNTSHLKSQVMLSRSECVRHHPICFEADYVVIVLLSVVQAMINIISS